ncbi:MAG: ATP-dependent Clp protease adaptor ClpS [Treponema sp.]|nr:ATP-dependent Clp protease adaptor ClpS [Treponema sp.]
MAVKNGLQFATRKSEKLKEPDEFRVILLNDHFTPMDFVIDILVSVFHKSETDARRIMLDIHRKGKGIVGQYPWDIAQTKAEQVHNLAQKREFPLRCIVEPV